MPDITIAEFQLLQRLIFLYGHDSYSQMAIFIGFYIYKNVVLVSCDINY